METFFCNKIPQFEHISNLAGASENLRCQVRGILLYPFLSVQCKEKLTEVFHKNGEIQNHYLIFLHFLHQKTRLSQN